jgi:hypothetical protein
LGKALPSIILTTSLEQTAYSALMARFLGEWVISKISDKVPPISQDCPLPNPHRSAHPKSTP